jgi:hypothetical protein
MPSSDDEEEPPPEEHRDKKVEEHRGKTTEKRKVNMQKFLNSHENLVDRLSSVTKQQSQLMELLVNHESERETSTKELTRLMTRIGEKLQQKVDSKDEKLKILSSVAETKASKRDALQERAKEVLEKKQEKLEKLAKIAENLKNLVPGEIAPPSKPKYGYDELPKVGVSLKVYGISNVDTASMKYEIDMTVMIDWEDPNMEEFKHKEYQLPELNYADQFFNPSVIVENAKANYDWLEGQDVFPRFNKLKTSDGKTWMKKTQRFRGELTIQEIKLETFPFDVQELPIKIKSKKCYIRLNGVAGNAGKPVKLDHNHIRQTHPDEEYKADYDKQEEKILKREKVYRRADMGHWIAEAVNDQLVEFQFRKIYGVSSFDKSQVRSEKTSRSLKSSSDSSTPSVSLPDEPEIDVKADFEDLVYKCGFPLCCLSIVCLCLRRSKQPASQGKAKPGFFKSLGSLCFGAQDTATDEKAANKQKEAWVFL